MNKIDQYIAQLVREVGTANGMPASLIEFQVKELQICVDRGYNSRAQIVSLLKKLGSK